MAWTDERVDILKKLWMEGLSASQIATRLGGVTRNAVIGKVHRLGLSGRATTSRAKSARPRKRKNVNTSGGRKQQMRTPGSGGRLHKLDPAASGGEQPGHNLKLLFNPVDELDIPVAERATMMTLKEHSCRWPIGDPCEDDFHFCGREKVEGRPYCEFHVEKAYQTSGGKKREPRRVAV